ncbi:hypothetical protein [Hydrogenispora ethanolica]|uniref:hypothetical protein n=1 Tax=Hydrogenispora ethanolica TaxID=1082276 RepID=UPI0010433781|nr:hypothetical protein [Hydrogenispora ethanolica]
MTDSQKELAERLSKLSHSQNKLAYPQKELAERLSELSYSQNQLADSQNKLTHPQKELAERLSKLSYPQNELARRLNELFQDPKRSVIHKTFSFSSSPRSRIRQTTLLDAMTYPSIPS